MAIAPRATLAQTFSVAGLCIALVVAASFAFFLRSSRARILDFSERLRLSAAQRVELRVARALSTAEDALNDVASDVRAGAVSTDDAQALEVELFTKLASSERLAEITFTSAQVMGDDAHGEALLAARGRAQLSTFRAADGRIITRRIYQTRTGFAMQSRDRSPGGGFASAEFEDRGEIADPTQDATFSVPLLQGNRERALWSDLHYSELDRGQPEPRVVLSVQRALSSAAGQVLGVLRVAMLTTDLDAISHLKVESSDPNDPHRIALLAVSMSPGHDARLVARLEPEDRVQVVDNDLRIVPAHPPAEMAALLASPLVHGLDPKHPNRDGVVWANDRRYLATLRELSGAEAGTAGWLVAVLVPEDHYITDLVRFEHLFGLLLAGTLAAVLLIGVLTVRIVQKGLSLAVRTTARMRGFDFTKETARSRVTDIDEVVLGLERAKTVVRAMEKYIPIDVVRRLYEHNEEPQLGGELRTVSLMFTDIEGFTTLAEQLPPSTLANHLGDYLEAMTSAVEAAHGTIDKYIGDAVMAFWNAPLPVERHAERCCEAVLACQEATRALYASPAWQGLPPLGTRFGLHTAEVMVGHFGARSRFNYTALGDGVNLAARLEPLCKQYGVWVLVSDAIVREAEASFVFRRVDRVAVKGKARAIDVYELLGRRGEPIPAADAVARYENAFEAYLARDFSTAADLLANATDDAPSRVLYERCQELSKAPPPADWDGVHVAKSK